MKNPFYFLFLLGLFQILIPGCEEANLKEGDAVSNESGLNDLFIYDVLNKTNQQITHTPDSIESRYQFLHHATALLFFTGKGGFYINVNESGKKKWIDTLLYSAPDLSADDQTIVYSLNKNLFLVNPDGSNKRQLTFDDLNAQSPKWSPDGQKIACVKSGTLYLVTLDGQVQTLSSGKIESVNWSSDSKTLVYYKFDVSKSEIYKYDLVTQREVQLTTLQKFCYHPVFNPVNNKICFTCSIATAGSDLMIMDSDGTNQQSIYHRASIENPSWSPDGNHLTFKIGDDNTVFTANIAVCDADGGNFQIINQKQGNCSIPIWSYDGKYILYRRLAPLGI